MKTITLVIAVVLFLFVNAARSDVRIRESKRPSSQAGEASDVSKDLLEALVESVIGLEEENGGGARLFMMPVDGRVSSLFGRRFDPITRASARHSGIDIAIAEGSEVRAAGDGRVVTAAFAGGCGRTVVIDHGDGYRTRYCHLSEIETERGDEVVAGEIIGRVGKSGRTTGPHLHFEVRNRGVATDPALTLCY